MFWMRKHSATTYSQPLCLGLLRGTYRWVWGLGQATAVMVKTSSLELAQMRDDGPACTIQSESAHVFIPILGANSHDSQD